MGVQIKSQYHTASWILILIGGIIAIASQSFAIQGYIMVMQFLPMMPPEYVPLMLLTMQFILVFIIATVILGILLLVSALITLWKSELIGGILAIIFSLILIFALGGLIVWVGAILAIIGGILGIIGARSQPKAPEPESI